MGQRAYRLAQGLGLPTAVAVIVLVLGSAQLFAGALKAGVTTDEPAQVDRTASWLDQGWFVPAELLVDDRPDPDNESATPYVYGPAFAALAHAGNVFLGNEAAGEVSRSADAYTVRHLTSATLALIAVVAVGAAVGFLTRTRSFALWAAAGLLALPEWTGQAFFNSKDVPAATGYTLITVALVIALGGAPKGRVGRRWRIAMGSMLAFGIIIAAGTRLALLLPLLVSLIAYAALRFGQRRLDDIDRDADTDLAVAAGAATGVGAIAVLYPKVAAAPLTFLAESVSGSSDYPYEGFTLTAGQLLSEHPPWWYLPAWVGASYPLLLGALALVGVALAVRIAAQAYRERLHGRIWRRPEIGLPLVLGQALLLPIGAILSGTVMYSGMRQHLYMLPALAILAGVGAHGLWTWTSARSHESALSRPIRGWVTALLCAALAIPMAEQALLFPYNYAYVNPLAGIGGVNDRWETDYWFASAPEALSRVPADAKLLCSARLVASEGETSILTPCGGDQFDPFADRRGNDVRSDHAVEAGIWVIARKRAGNRAPDNCKEVDEVSRWLRGERVKMAFVLRCSPP